MDIRVDDSQIIPVTHRILCDLGKLPEHVAFPTDARGILAYSAAERDAIAAALDKLKLPYTIEAVDQPNAAHVEQLQGHVSSRSEALSALEALGQGETPAIPELRLKQIEADVTELKAAKEVIPK
ncbi:MAG TPA: hypothetical protein VMY87_07440 [Armatimonadota bacterium]|nr:hypothetical protein [Armatimonadota bacterium]